MIDLVDVDGLPQVEAVLPDVRDVQRRGPRQRHLHPVLHCTDEGSFGVVLEHRQRRRTRRCSRSGSAAARS